jgi:hypothetical protein
VFIRIAVVAWAVAVAPAYASPFDLFRKTGAILKPTPLQAPVSCYADVAPALHQTVGGTIADQIEQPLAVTPRDPGLCIATAINAIGYFSADRAEAPVPGPSTPLQAMVPGAALVGSALMLAGLASRKRREQSHHLPVLRRKRTTRRQMAPL